MSRPRRIAVIGSGVAGLTAAHVAAKRAHVTLYEADTRLGGHADTHHVAGPDGGHLAIDTGFIVHNERTYPTLLRLFAELGVVTQDSHLFHETIAENLRYAKPDATDEQMWDALRGAQVAELVRSLPEGLDTVVGERGYRFSGGEKQRIAIARLLLKHPSIVILDEATAHLDSESEAAVQRALSVALQGRTALVIAHRLSTVRDADQILVLDQGRIVERGRHEELVAAGGLYAELYRTQFAMASPDPTRFAEDVEIVTVPATTPIEP